MRVGRKVPAGACVNSVIERERERERERDDFGSQMFDQTHFVKIIDSALKKTFLSTLVKITSFESSRYLTFLPQRHF